MLRAQAEQPCPLRQAGEQWAVVARQPAVEGARPHAFEREEQRDGHHLTRIEVGLRVFGHSLHLVIDSAKQRSDKIDGGHGVLLLAGVWTPPAWGALHVPVN